MTTCDAVRAGCVFVFVYLQLDAVCVCPAVCVPSRRLSVKKPVTESTQEARNWDHKTASCRNTSYNEEGQEGFEADVARSNIMSSPKKRTKDVVGVVFLPVCLLCIDGLQQTHRRLGLSVDSVSDHCVDF